MSEENNQSRETPRAPSSRQSPDPQGLKSKILRLLASPKYQPLDKVELTKKLGLSSDDRAQLKEVLRALEQDGDIARIRKDRYVLPDTADLFTGTVTFHEKGYAFVVSGKAGEADLFITAENTWTALQGDRVRRPDQPRGFRGPARPPLPGRGRRTRGARGGSSASSSAPTTPSSARSRSPSSSIYVVADDPRFIHNIYVHPGQVMLPASAAGGRQGGHRTGRRGRSRHVNPEGKIIEVLGPASKAGVDMLSIIRKYHLPEEFPQGGHAGRRANSRRSRTTPRSPGARTCARISSSRSTRTTRATSTTRSRSRPCLTAAGGWGSTSPT